MDDETKRRLAQNEVLFRDLNQEIKAVADELGGFDHPYDFVCECSDVRCNTRVTATLREYESVRARPDRFLLADGHEMPELERVVARNSRFATVEKFGEAKKAVSEGSR